MHDTEMWPSWIDDLVPHAIIASDIFLKNYQTRTIQFKQIYNNASYHR